MIVRIATEGQYELPDAWLDRLNELDDAVVAAVEAGDPDAFGRHYGDLLGHVRAGQRLDVENLLGSDVIVPPPDISFEEASREFTGDGLIPD